jgi:hypothetical protein
MSDILQKLRGFRHTLRHDGVHYRGALLKSPRDIMRRSKAGNGDLDIR